MPTPTPPPPRMAAPPLLRGKLCLFASRLAPVQTRQVFMTWRDLKEGSAESEKAIMPVCFAVHPECCTISCRTLVLRHIASSLCFLARCNQWLDSHEPIPWPSTTRPLARSPEGGHRPQFLSAKPRHRPSSMPCLACYSVLLRTIAQPPKNRFADVFCDQRVRVVTQIAN